VNTSTHSRDGVIVVDKPQGLTSHDVVAAARRLLGERRIGHTGTLDPLATGVLPLACGRATRLVQFLTASDKDYDATIRFGVTTDSYDVTGAETSRCVRRPERDAVARALIALSGPYLQTPPAFSAKKVDGRRAYDLARLRRASGGAGREDQVAALTPVPVTVTRAELVELSEDIARVRLTCTAGFYVRTFAHTLGELVGTGACLEALRRTRSGEFRLEHAVGIAALGQDQPAAATALVPLDALLTGFPHVTVTDEGRDRVSHGQEVEGTPEGSAAWVRLTDRDGHLIAMARAGSRPGSLHPAVVLI
jgi:tRNA pseudouridine55 synthase